jgi:hypothetical protein
MSPEPQRISAKEAVGRAVRYLQDMYGDSITDILLEEIESTPSGSIWDVTLSFTRPGAVDRATGSIGAILGDNRPRRHYKAIRVEASTGDVLSMKVWKDDKQS